jgi:hypothetical protein
LSWPFAWSSTFSFFRFLAPRVLHNSVFHANRIFCNPAFRVSGFSVARLSVLTTQLEPPVFCFVLPT